MKQCFLPMVLMIFLLCSVTSMGEAVLTQEDAIALAVDEVTRGTGYDRSTVTDPARYRTIVMRNESPEQDSVRGETWFVRFDAVDKLMTDSLIVGLNGDGSLRYVDIALCDSSLASCEELVYADLLDQYESEHGVCLDWPISVWMSFSIEACKGKPGNRNTWRIQHAVYIPEPDGAVGRDRAKDIAREACGDDRLEPHACVTLLDGERMIYRMGLSKGNGWEQLVEIDCMTGDVISVRPFVFSINSWLDCYIPQSVTDLICSAESQEVLLERAAYQSQPNPHTFRGYDKSLSNSVFSYAPETAITADRAWEIAVDAVRDRYQTNVKDEYQTSFGYNAAPTDFQRVPYWQFDFVKKDDPLDAFEIIINAQSGEIIYTCGPGEGNG